MGMQVGNIAELLKAKVLTPELDLSSEVNHAFASDLMSDVLIVGTREDTFTITGKLFKMLRKE